MIKKITKKIFVIIAFFAIFQISIAANTDPEITSDGGAATATVNVDENETAVTIVTATDADAGDTITYGISGGDDSAKFDIDPNSGVLSLVDAPDFETPTDSDADNVYEVQVFASDGTTQDTQDISVAVANINEAPVITSNGGGDTAAITVDENQSAVTDITSTDEDAGDDVTFDITGDDASKFSMSASGILTFSPSPDFEDPIDVNTDNVYEVTVTVSDDAGASDSQDISVTVANINEAPTDISISNDSQDENLVNETIGTFSTTDSDAADTHSYTLACAVAGADDGDFYINGANELRVGDPFDYEIKNSYSICIRTTDAGGLTFDKNFTIHVNNVNEAPTDISLSANSQDENLANVVIGTLSTIDQDAGNTFTYSFDCTAAGADDAKFSISNTNELKTNNPFDFETKNSYSICIRTTDNNGLTYDKAFTVTVNDVDESPVIDNATVGPISDATPVDSNIYNVNNSGTGDDNDVDGDAITYSITNGNASNDFAIDSADGQITNAKILDYAVSPYILEITATSTHGANAPLSTTGNITINVSNGDVAPNIANATAAPQNEDVTLGTIFYNVDDSGTLTDFDANHDVITYAITGGDVSNDFSINQSTGEITNVNTLDFETKPTYSLEITASSTHGALNALTNIANIQININDINEDPSFNSNATDITVNENQTAVVTFTATDPEGTTLTYSFDDNMTAGPNDNFTFNIDSSTGEITFKTSPDYENPTDNVVASSPTKDNIYRIKVKVIDTSSKYAERYLMVHVEDVDESSSSSGGHRSRTYACRDEKAINYSETGTHRDYLCEYATEESEETTQTEEEKAEQERLAREKAANDIIEQERLAREKAANDIIEQERLAREKAAMEKQNLINEIKAKIAEIRQKIADILKNRNFTYNKVCVKFNKNLKPGSYGNEVQKMQNFLKERGYLFTGYSNGYFDSVTEKAVNEFQERYASDILYPLSIYSPTGNWYSSTIRKANELMNCQR